MITFEWSDWRNGHIWWLQSVYIDEDYRNQKIFSRLYKYIVELARARKDVTGLRLYVEEHNEAAKRVYKALGMKKAPYEIYQMDLE